MATRPTSRLHYNSWQPVWGEQPPAHCTNLFINSAFRTKSYDAEFTYPAFWGHDCSSDPSGSKDCYPWLEQERDSDDPGAFYSPASSCPTGWTTVSAPNDLSRVTDVESSETVLFCCPSGFEPLPSVAQPSASGLYRRFYCTARNKFTRLPAICPSTSGPPEETRLSSWDFSARLLQLRYQTDGPNTTDLISDGGARRLSVAATAAIAVIIPILVIGLVVLGLFLLRRRRNQHNKSNGLFDHSEIPADKSSQYSSE